MGVRNDNSTDYVHPDEPNLLNLHKAMQYNANGEPEIRTVTGITGNIIIEGNVNIPGNVEVFSSPDNPVHTHITEIGNSGILTVPFMPIDGNVFITGGNLNANVSGSNVTIDNTTFEVTQGTDPWHISGNVSVSGGNITTTLDEAGLTAFQEPLSVQITPVIQLSAVYGLDSEDWKTTQLNNGNVSVDNNSTWLVQSGTSAGGYARLASQKSMTYQPGQGSMFRWTAAFTTTGGTTKNAFGIDNIVQNTGPIDPEDGYSVGYSGATDDDNHRKIGFLHRRNGLREIRQLTVTVAPTGTQTATITLNGVAFQITLTASTSTQYTATQIATLLKADSVCNNTWEIEACGGVVTFIYYSPGSKNGTYSFSSAGTGTTAVASFSQLISGVSPQDTWTYVDDWDNQTITFDPTKLNVFGLDFRWLGAGIVRLFMENPVTGKMTLIHTQKFASTQTYPHLNKPSLRLIYRSGTTNSAVTPSQNVIVRGASVFAGIQGLIRQTGISQSYFALDSSSRAKDIVWHLLSIQNPLTRVNDVNKSSLIIQDLTISAQGNDPSVIYVIKNCVGTSDYIVFTPVPGQTNFKFAQYSVSAVTENLALDTVVLTQAMGINGSASFGMEKYNLTLSPGEFVSVFISSTNGLTRTSCGITWKVD